MKPQHRLASQPAGCAAASTERKPFRRLACRRRLGSGARPKARVESEPRCRRAQLPERFSPGARLKRVPVKARPVQGENRSPDVLAGAEARAGARPQARADQARAGAESKNATHTQKKTKLRRHTFTKVDPTGPFRGLPGRSERRAQNFFLKNETSAPIAVNCKKKFCKFRPGKYAPLALNLKKIL